MRFHRRFVTANRRLVNARYRDMENFIDPAAARRQSQ
jgi:hypothetical protein